MDRAKQNTIHELVQNRFVRKMSEDFDYKPRGDWFSFAWNKLGSRKTSIFSHRRLCYTLRYAKPCGALFMMDGCTLLDFYWATEYQHPFTAIIKLERARTFLILLQLHSSERRKSYTPKMVWGVSKSWGNLIFWVSYSFKSGCGKAAVSKFPQNAHCNSPLTQQNEQIYHTSF